MTITIIGGGACGLAVFAELVTQLRLRPHTTHLSIFIVEKDPEIGPGLAFGTRQFGHLLNTPADLMSLYPHEGHHFQNWLTAHEAERQEALAEVPVETHDYPPRRLYGDYLEGQFRQTEAVARAAGIRTEVLHDEALDLLPVGNQAIVRLASGRKLPTDVTVLAMGTPRPGTYRHLEGLSRYFDFPWPSSALTEQIPPDADVAILGSSLSAIDTLMTFADHDHRGKLRFYSPNGLLPRVQAKAASDYVCQWLNLGCVRQLMREQGRLPRVTDLYRLFCIEYESLTGQPFVARQAKRKHLSAAQRLDEDIATAERSDDPVQQILYATRYDASPIWQLLPDSEKVRFKALLGEAWAINRHCMPLVNARRVQHFFHTGQLSVHAGVCSVGHHADSDTFSIALADRRCHRADYVVNATGTATRPELMSLSLVQNLLHRELITSHPAGGIRVNPRSLRVGASEPILYTLGQLASGTLLDTNALWFNVQCAEQLVADICDRLA